MKEDEDEYLVSCGDAEDEYGLFVMKADESMVNKEAYLAYFYDQDRFFHIQPDKLKLFVKPRNLNSCNDEFGNEYAMEALKSRIKEAIKAFKEELPGWERYVRDMDERLSTLE